MKRMGKVLLAVLVLLLTCSLVIVAGSSTATTTSKGGKKLIKIWVSKDTGQVLDVKLGKDDGTDEKDADLVSPTLPAQYIGTMLFHKSSPGCIVIVAGGYAWQVCW